MNQFQQTPNTSKKIINFLICGTIGAGIIMLIASVLKISVSSTALLAGIFGLAIATAMQEWVIPAVKKYWEKK